MYEKQSEVRYSRRCTLMQDELLPHTNLERHEGAPPDPLPPNQQGIGWGAGGLGARHGHLELTQTPVVPLSMERSRAPVVAPPYRRPACTKMMRGRGVVLLHALEPAAA